MIGNPVAHSRSPFIHAAFGQQTGIALEYEKLCAPMDGFAPAVAQFFSAGGIGLNVTVPFKEQAWALAQHGLSDRAKIAGAVNTLWQDNGQLKGCNTDGVGLLTDLRRQDADPKNKKVLLVGAGGAAKGVAFPLLEAGCAQLHVINRTSERATALRESVLQHKPTLGDRLTAGDLNSANGQWDIVINATSSSLGDQVPAIAGLSFADGSMAYDMFYAAQPTAFMRYASQQGASKVCDGLGMLVGQAAVSFDIWHGVMPDVAPVLQALRKQLNDRV